MAHSFGDEAGDAEPLETGIDCCLVESVATVIVV
jgi:hypothetical protein